MKNLISLEKDVLTLLSKRYNNVDEIKRTLNILKESCDDKGIFYNENRKLILDLISSPYINDGSAILRDRFIKNSFVKKLTNLGINIKTLERDFYYANDKLFWLKTGAMTPINRKYWIKWDKNDYEKLGKNAYIIVLLGSEEIALIIPKEIHNQWFSDEITKNKSDSALYYESTIFPNEFTLDIKVNNSKVEEIKEYINDFKLLGIYEKNPKSIDVLIYAQFLSATILSSKDGTLGNKKSKKETSESSGRKGRVSKDFSVVLENIQPLVKDKIFEIFSFVDCSGINPPSNEKLCFWLWFCYEFSLYKEGSLIFRKIDKDSVSPDLYKMVRDLGLACERRLEYT